MVNVSQGWEFDLSLACGLAFIESFEGTQPLSFSDISRRTGLSRCTVRRVLCTLSALGHVYSGRGRFTITPIVLRLGFSFLNCQPVV